MLSQRIPTCWIMVALLVAPVAQARGQNLLIDSGFDDVGQLPSWRVGQNVALTWNPDDAAGNIASGSGEITNMSALAQIDGIFQCVPVSMGKSYRLEGWLYVPSGNANASVHLTAFFSDSNNCIGSNLGEPVTPSFSAMDQWVFVETEIVAPGGAISAEIRVLIFKLEEGGQSVARADNLFFGPSPDIFADGFETLVVKAR